jgi:hypothetical protein
MHIYEVRPRKDGGVDLISDVLPFGRLWYDKSDHAIGYAMHYSGSHELHESYYRRESGHNMVSPRVYKPV